MPARKNRSANRPRDARGDEVAIAVLDAERTRALRELFWHNVVREMLTSIAMLCERAAAKGAAEPASDILDGRLAVITASGERIPIAHVTPVFACGVPGTELHRALSLAVECTVFQITAPSGEQYTLPLHEVRGIHAFTEELMKQLQAQVAPGQAAPFGFAAFTSVARAAEEHDSRRAGESWSGPAI